MGYTAYLEFRRVELPPLKVNMIIQGYDAQFCTVKEADMPRAVVFALPGARIVNTGSSRALNFAVCWANMMPAPQFSYKILLFCLKEGDGFFYGFDPNEESLEGKSLFGDYPLLKAITTGELNSKWSR